MDRGVQSWAAHWLCKMAPLAAEMRQTNIVCGGDNHRDVLQIAFIENRFAGIRPQMSTNKRQIRPLVPDQLKGR